MTKSQMRVEVEELLNDKSITIRELSEATGVGESVIKKLKSGRQTIDKTYFESVEKLFEYKMIREKGNE
ncbi:helix-turn-helix domain-containing protein [Salinicoccus sp. CNSTN-B1]